jgi:general L-amino acid transport system permease protein
MTMTISTEQEQTPTGRGINWQLFLQDNVTGSWFQAVLVALLTLVTAVLAVGQLEKLPVSTIIVLIAWLVGISTIVVGELRGQHTRVSRWLKANLLSSVSNALITLLMSLIIVSALYGVLQWGVVNASFDPERTTPEFQPENGATWGVIWGARKLLMTGLLEPTHTWRVMLALGFIVAMWAATFLSGRQKLKERLRIVRRVTNGLWLLSPVILYIFLAGIPDNSFNLGALLTGAVVLLAIYALLWWQKVINFNWLSLAAMALVWPLLYTIWWGIGQSGIFSPINVDNWGGIMLTLIIASSVILMSLPLGMALALGRRSQVFGIPSWIIWPVAIGASIWGFTTTPELLATSRNAVEQLIAFWPVLILAVAYLLQRTFKGNVVAGASTAFIELVRSVPLITLLFMGIVMAPFFFQEGISIAKPWPVIVGYTIFSSAYMAETIRGGLQAIPNGQYEAADALGFNALQKMRFIILPQAIRIVIPAIVGQFIGAYKSSSLVSIVGLFDFVGISRSIVANPSWLGLRLELYVFMAIVYFAGSFMMSSYSRRLEVRLGVGQR